MYKTFNHKYGSDVITIYAGEYYVSNKKEIISTVVGSCIAVCLFDKIKDIGGMNHFMLPYSSKENHISATASNRYGVTSIKNLLKGMEKLGASRENIQAKIFGGGSVLTTGNNNSKTVGDLNIEFARKYLRENNIKILNEDVGDFIGRNITYLSSTTKVFVKKIPMGDISYLEKELIQIL